MPEWIILDEWSKCLLAVCFGHLPIKRCIEFLHPMPSRHVLGFKGSLLQQLCCRLLSSNSIFIKLHWLYRRDLFGDLG